jgi:hypothetical protein
MESDLDSGPAGFRDPKMVPNENGNGNEQNGKKNGFLRTSRRRKD